MIFIDLLYKVVLRLQRHELLLLVLNHVHVAVNHSSECWTWSCVIHTGLLTLVRSRNYAMTLYWERVKHSGELFHIRWPVINNQIMHFTLLQMQTSTWASICCSWSSAAVTHVSGGVGETRQQTTTWTWFRTISSNSCLWRSGRNKATDCDMDVVQNHQQ